MKLVVPNSVNVKDLVSVLGLSPTRLESLKNKIYYFLSLLVITNDNYKLYEKTGGYRQISSVTMRKIMGRKDYYFIIKLLSAPLDPIIESNDSWRSSKKGEQKGFCKGYRLAPKYNTGEIVYKSVPDKMTRRIQKYIRHNKEDDFDDSKYQFLYNQFKKHKLSFDPGIRDYIRDFGNKLLSRIDNGNEFQVKMVLNLIGRWLYSVERIENNDTWFGVSADNHRLNSSITHLKRNLRSFLLCDDKPLGMVDIRASQPYLLSTIMHDNFLVTGNSRYNMYSIYPELFNILFSKNLCGKMSSTGICDPSYEYYSVSGSSIHTEFGQCSGTGDGLNQISYSFMWGQFFNDKEIRSIKKYQSAPFEDDFYRYVLTQSSPEIKDYSQEERQKFKDSMMLVFFDDKKRDRNNVHYIKVFSGMFPGVEKWITSAHKQIGNDRFAYLLQRAESYLVLDIVAREFNSNYPSAPVFTIHDAICTYPEYLPDLQQLVLGRFYDITGVKVGLKSTCLTPNPEPKPEDIEEEWQKIRPIYSLRKYNKANYHVLTDNIRRGSEFLLDY